MYSPVLVSQRNNIFLIIHFVFAALSSAYLFYLDESSFSFDWVRHAGNWIAFAIYTSFFFFIQWAVKWTILKSLKGYLQTFLSAIIVSVFMTLAMVIIFGH